MRRLLLFLILALGACTSSIPMVQKFPDPPTDLQDPPPLKKVIKGSPTSEVLRIINYNYGLYKIRATRERAWNAWWKEQATITNKATK